MVKAVNVCDNSTLRNIISNASLEIFVKINHTLNKLRHWKLRVPVTVNRHVD